MKDFNILDYDNSAVDLIILELLFWARNVTIRLENEKMKKTSNLRNFTLKFGKCQLSIIW